MRICSKHQMYLDQLSDNEIQMQIISEYNDKLDIVSYQDKIEARKNCCQICYFGAIGKKMLEKIIKEKVKKFSVFAKLTL